MTLPSNVVRRLRNTPVRELILALEKDGFTYRRARGSGRVYRHRDGRRAVIHFHRSNDTLPLGTLRSVMAGTRWSKNDLERLGLLIAPVNPRRDYRLLRDFLPKQSL